MSALGAGRRGAAIDLGLVAVLVLAAVGVVVLTVRTVAAIDGDFVSSYGAPLYWMDYRGGFVRRGLPGALLSLGGTPSYGLVLGAGLALTVSGGVGVVALGWRLVRLAGGAVARVAVGVLVVASPFVMLVLPGSVGRYDAVGVVAAAVVALLPLVRWAPGWVVAVVLALVGIVAGASEEFLVGYLVPVAVAAAARLGRGRVRRAVGMAVVIVVPGVLVAVASLLSPPDRRLIGETLALARKAGVPGVGRVNAVTALGNTLREQLALFVDFDGGTLVGLLALFGLLFAALSTMLWLLVGRPAPRMALAAGLWLAIVAVVVTVVGMDVGRWWGLAFVGFVACLAVESEAATGRRMRVRAAAAVAWREAATGRRLQVWAVALALVCVPATLLPAVPPLATAAGSAARGP